MQVKTNRDNISLEETLAFIKYLNREKPFDKEEVVVPTHDLEEVKGQKPTQIPREKSKKYKHEEVSEDLTKKINKNRAIKRIIESAFQILQNFSNYEEEIGRESDDKSSEIQFNIYLKQYNRVLERIHQLEKEKLNFQSEQAEQREEVLQNIYEYTVVQDFRQILPVAFLKDKISKTNIEIMIDSLSKSLVILKPHQLRIYESPQISQNFRTIKLHEIQNVDYHTQPHILMVLSIQKDKERFNVYMQFQSQKNQEKWDRALYCCYIGRKMKTKEKFFLIEYPEEDVKKKEKEETKKQAAFSYQFQVQRKTPLDQILTEKSAPQYSDLSKEDYQDNEDVMSKSKSKSNTKGNKKPLSSISQQDHQRTIQNEDKISSDKPLYNKSNKYTVNEVGTNRQLDVQEKQKNNEIVNRVKTDYIEIRKPTNLEADNPSPVKEYTDKDKTKVNIFGNIDENRDETDRQNELKFLKEEDALPDDIIEIHNLERKHVKGLVLEKQKFFFNKSKKLYLREGIKPEKEEQSLQLKKTVIQKEHEAMKWRELMYLDFDSSSGEESNPKIIKLVNIKSYQMKGEKTLIICHNKEISFSGDPNVLKEVYRWIDLIHNIYKKQLTIENQQDLSGKFNEQ